MALLLFIVGAVALMAGVSMAAYGIPINEFSFGNTMIIAGCSLAAGGLIVIGLGAVVNQLQRIGEMLTVWTPGRAPVGEIFDEPGLASGAGPEGRMPFRPRPPAFVPPIPAEPDQTPREAAPAAPAADLFVGMPSLPNPAAEAGPVAVEVREEVVVSTWQAAPPEPEAPAEAPEEEQRTNRQDDFDSMWPDIRGRDEAAPGPAKAEPEPAPATSSDFGEPPEFLRRREFVQREDEPDRGFEPEPEPEPAPEPEPERMAETAPPADEAPADEPPQQAAVLKSGTVDGMAYTLYVDGSIEAELPQGTLRFSSINDLRNYLEANT